MEFTPFDNGYRDVSAQDLTLLRNVSEGWYVEYKSELIATRRLAKSLASFANQYGGWLFIGVQEDPDNNAADSFPGIANDQVPEVLETLRNASKDVISSAGEI